MPRTSKVEALLLLTEIAPGVVRLPMVLPVTLPMLTRPLLTLMPTNAPDVPVPPTLVVSEPVDKDLMAALVEQIGHRVTAVHQPREQRRVWLEMAQKNASLQLARLLAEDRSSRPGLIILGALAEGSL